MKTVFVILALIGKSHSHTHTHHVMRWAVLAFFPLFFDFLKKKIAARVVSPFAAAVTVGLECDDVDPAYSCLTDYASCQKSLPDPSSSGTEYTRLCPCILTYGTCLDATGCYGEKWKAYGEMCNGKPNCTGCLTSSASSASLAASLVIALLAAFLA
jgi:hypothetical protein